MFWIRCRLRMLKRKLQDLTVCCTYKVDFLHQKAHSVKEFRKQYEVHEEIGRGGFGIVYKAIRTSDNLPVAVKFVEHKHVREWTMSNNQLIPSELCHLETCSNIPGVIRLIDWFASSKGFLIVMERPENCMDVFDLVSTYGRLDEMTARAIFTQVVDTVCGMYAKHGLIHRDIKDENIIVDMRTGEVKLVDLGATAPIEKAMKKEFQGTRSYCPPEWFRQLQYLPLEATSWSLGVLLFILVTGQLPFKNEIQICLGRVKFPSYVSKECCQLIKSCLTTACGSRASLADIRQHPWMNHEITTHEQTFQQVLDATLGRKDRRSQREIDAEQAAEEYRQVNDVILTEEPRSLPLDDDCADTCSESTMATAIEDIPPLVPLARLKSRYDNISTSSLADYMSLASLAITDKPADTVSVATTATAMYFSAAETEEDEEESSLSDLVVGPVKSASAYNLAARARKRSMVFKSFDRELDTVLEQGHEHLPLVMTCSVSSNNSAEEATLCESPPPSPRRRLSSTDDDSSFSGACDAPPHTCRPSASSSRPSRHRPLKMMVAPPSLNVFEVKPMAAT